MNNNSQPQFAWTAFYSEFADKLLKYKDSRPALLEIVSNIYASLGMRCPFQENDVPIDDICPFTIFGCFNKGITDENRKVLMQKFGDRLGVQAELPTKYDGIPVLNNLSARFFGKADRKMDDISNLWDIFATGIIYADNPTEQAKRTFITCYDKVRKQLGIKWNLTMGLYWIRPYSYLNLDKINRAYLLGNAHPSFVTLSKISSLKQPPDARAYLELIALCKESFAKVDSPYHSFPELSHGAWMTTVSEDTNSHGNLRNPTSFERNPNEKHYWLFAPGASASKWDEFSSKGIMGIDFTKNLGDLRQYLSREAIRAKMKELGDISKKYTMDSLATWQFANDMKNGDIVYAKKGMYKIVGRGIVTSDYIYDQTRSEYKHSRTVRWTNIGEWEHPGQAVTKTLTDITVYTDYVQKLELIFADDAVAVTEVINDKADYPPYFDVDFLSEVFMDAESYQTLVNLLKMKKNIILQGAPGVGKTFAAKRLAYSMIGQRDASRVMMVQFHQSYSYEDFIMGFRPAKNGFSLAEGPFYEFCKKAQDDIEQDYFFIIDEINRGNLSKIFGELLMLIEKDKRGEKLRLLYSNELFSVPHNVHLVGIMNTADRSLAMIDYALRRRFAFFELKPAFDSEGFGRIMAEADSPKLTSLVEQIKALNEFISKDESLGDGFRIGHSYLCTDDEISDEWLAAVVKYEILPLLGEYWFDEQSKIEHWTSKLYNAIND